MVGSDGHRLEVGQVEGGSAGGSERGRAGDDGIGIGLRTRTHAGRDCGRHRGGGVPGRQRLQWSRVEWSGAEWSGVERSGAEWSGVEQSGAERSGA